jgi:hypothetical protein
MVEVNPSKKHQLVAQISTAKRAGDVAQLVEHLSSKCKDLSSNPTTYKII